jgi:hypothetical protein
MEAMIQPVNSCTISPASQKAESLLHPAQSFKETLRKQSGAKDQGQGAEGPLHPAESCKPVHQKQKHSVVEKESKDQGQRAGSALKPSQSLQEVHQKNSVAKEKNKDEGPEAESRLQPAASFDEVLQKQAVAEEENKDPGPGKLAAAFLSNLLPVLPNLGGLNNLEKINLSEAQLPGQPLNQDARVTQNPQAPFIVSLPETMENPEENILPFPTAQAKADSSADPKNIWNEGTVPLLDNLPDPSLGKISIQSQFPEGAVQTKGTFPKSELHPSLFLKQQEKTIASFSDVINELPEGQKKSLFVTGTTVQRTPWAMGNEAPKNDFLKSEFNGNLLGQKITLPGFSTDSPMLLAFDEKLDILLGQNSTGEEVAGRSLNDEFTGFGNPAAEKNGAKAIAGGENHPTQDPFGLNELLGSPKPSTVAEENGIPQKLPLSRTEHPDPYQQIAEKVIWSIRNNQERIRLTLEPPQLGNLFIELHRNKDEIKATLWADNPKTKEILENNQFQLQKTLEGHGFKLEQFEVFVQHDMGSFPGKEENPVFQGPGGRAQSLQIEEAEWPPSLETLPGAISASGGSQYIDRFI